MLSSICVFSDFCFDNWIFYSGFKSACTTVNGLPNLWSHCCNATYQLAQSDRWQSLVPEVLSSSLKWSKNNIDVNCLVSLFSCLLLRIAKIYQKIAQTRPITAQQLWFLLLLQVSTMWGINCCSNMEEFLKMAEIWSGFQFSYLFWMKYMNSYSNFGECPEYCE